MDFDVQSGITPFAKIQRFGSNERAHDVPVGERPRQMKTQWTAAAVPPQTHHRDSQRTRRRAQRDRPRRHHSDGGWNAITRGVFRHCQLSARVRLHGSSGRRRHAPREAPTLLRKTHQRDALAVVTGPTAAATQMTATTTVNAIAGSLTRPDAKTGAMRHCRPATSSVQPSAANNWNGVAETRVATQESNCQARA